MNNLIKRLAIGAATLASVTFAGSYEANADSFKYALDGAGNYATYHTHPSEPKQKALKNKNGFPGKDAIIFANEQTDGKNGYKTIAYSPSSNQVYFLGLNGSWQKANKINGEYNSKDESKGILPGETVFGKKELPQLSPKPSASKKTKEGGEALYLFPQLPSKSVPSIQSFRFPLTSELHSEEAKKEAITRYTLSLGFSGERTGLTASIDWKLGGKFRLGPYFTKFNSDLTKHDDSAQVAGTALELVGPGVYRQRNDSVKTTKEETLSDREFGAVLSYKINDKFEVFGTFGRTERETLERKTLSSTVTFKDSDGKVIGSPQVATNILSPNKSKENVSTLSVGGDYSINNHLFLRGQVKIIGEDNQKVEPSVSGVIKF